MSLPSLNASINFQLNSANISSVIRQLQSQVGGVSLNINTANAQKNIASVNNQLRRGADFVDNFALAIGNSARKFSAYAAGTLLITKLINIFRATTSELIRFDKEVVKLAQITETAVSNMAGLKKELLELSVRTGISASKLAEMTGVLAQAGIKGKELTTVIETLAKTDLAATFDNITETAEGLIAVKSQFKLFGSEITEAFDQINQVAKEFAVESADLIEAVKKAGGVFAASGGKLDEFLAVITSVRATTRESAESIATGLRTIFARVQRPKTLDFLREYGIELANLEGEFVGPYEAIERLSVALKEQGIVAGTIEFSKIAEELGGIRQLSKFIPLITESALRTDVLAAAQKRAAGSLDKDMATGLKSVSRQLEILKAEFNKMIIGFQDDGNIVRIAKTLLSLATSIVKVTDSLRELAPLLVAISTFKLGTIAAGFFGKGSKFSTDIPGAAVGGKVIGGSGNKDDVLARLMGGEFVINKRSAKRIGYDSLEELNAYGGGGKVTGGNAAGLAGSALVAGSVATGFLGLGDDNNRILGDATNSLVVNIVKLSAALYTVSALNEVIPAVKTKFGELTASSASLVEVEKTSKQKLIEFNQALKNAGVSTDSRRVILARTARGIRYSGDVDSSIQHATDIHRNRVNTSPFYSSLAPGATGGRAQELLAINRFDNAKREEAAAKAELRAKERSEKIANRTNLALVGVGVAAGLATTALSIMAESAERAALEAIESGDAKGAVEARNRQNTTKRTGGFISNIGIGAGVGAQFGGPYGAAILGTLGAIKSALEIDATGEFNQSLDDSKKIKEGNFARIFDPRDKESSGLRDVLKKTADPAEAARLKADIKKNDDAQTKLLLENIAKESTKDKLPKQLQRAKADYTDAAKRQAEILVASLEDLLASGGSNDEITKTGEELAQLQRYLKISEEVILAETRNREAFVKAVNFETAARIRGASALQASIDAQIRLTATLNDLEDRSKTFQKNDASSVLSGEFGLGKLSGTRFTSGADSLTDPSRSNSAAFKGTIAALIRGGGDIGGAADRVSRANSRVDASSGEFEKIFKADPIAVKGMITTLTKSLVAGFGPEVENSAGEIEGLIADALSKGVGEADLLSGLKEALGGHALKDVQRAVAAYGANADALADSLQEESAARKLFLDIQIGYLTQLNSLTLEAKRVVNPSDLGGNRRKTAQASLAGTGIKLTGDDAGDLRGLSKEALSLQQELVDLKRSVELGAIENDVFQHKQRELTDRFNSVSEAMNVLADATDEASLSIERERAKQDALRGAAGDLAFGGRDNARQTSLLLRGVSHLQSGGRASQFGEEQRDKLYQFLQKFGDVRVFGNDTGNDIINREIAQWARENGASQEDIKKLLGDIQTPEKKQLEELIAIRKLLSRNQENNPGFAPENGVAGKSRFAVGPGVGKPSGRKPSRFRPEDDVDEFVGPRIPSRPGNSRFGIKEGFVGPKAPRRKSRFAPENEFVGPKNIEGVIDLRDNSPAALLKSQTALGKQRADAKRDTPEMKAIMQKIREENQAAQQPIIDAGIMRSASYNIGASTPEQIAGVKQRQLDAQNKKLDEEEAERKKNVKTFIKDGIRYSSEFFTGGIVGGRSGKDTNMIRATKGEGVLRNQAMQKIGPEAFNRLNQTGSLPGYESFASAVQLLQKAPNWVKEFRASVDALAGTSIRAELAPVSVNVRINGAEVLASLTKDMQVLVRDEIIVAVRNIYHSDGTGKHGLRGRA